MTGAAAPSPSGGPPVERDLETYYRKRADEYDEVYRKPERQADIARLAELVRRALRDRRVLEVAAGTGHWTQVAATVATCVVATDIAEETLSVARRRDYGSTLVDFAVGDAWNVDRVPGRFDAGLACFWLSHLRRDQVTRFVQGLAARLDSGGVVVLADNRYVEGSNHPVTRTDTDGNTYQRRVLGDGSQFEVLKNFFDGSDLERLASAVGEPATPVLLDYYWFLTVRTG